LPGEIDLARIGAFFWRVPHVFLALMIRKARSLKSVSVIDVESSGQFCEQMNEIHIMNLASPWRDRGMQIGY
jgi:hypothetical protein